jgi:hypothetical protein
VHFRDSTPADGQIRVEEVWIRYGYQLGKSVSPSTLDAVGVKIVADALGLAVAERYITAEHPLGDRPHRDRREVSIAAP